MCALHSPSRNKWMLIELLGMLNALANLFITYFYVSASSVSMVISEVLHLFVWSAVCNQEKEIDIKMPHECKHIWENMSVTMTGTVEDERRVSDWRGGREMEWKDGLSCVICSEESCKPLLLRAVDPKRLIGNQNSYQLFNRYRVNQLQRRRHGRRGELKGERR